MKFVKIEWLHGWSDRPEVTYLELDGHSRERRKVEVFADREAGCADAWISIGGTRLSPDPVPPVTDMAERSDCRVSSVTPEQFLDIWLKHAPRGEPLGPPTT